MSETPIDNAVALIGATNALRDWFMSQDIAPHDAMMTMEYFIAQMVAANSKGALDDEDKYSLIENTIRTFVMQIRMTAK